MAAMVNPDVLRRLLKELDEDPDHLERAQRYSGREFENDPEHVYSLLKNQLDDIRRLRRVWALPVA